MAGQTEFAPDLSLHVMHDELHPRLTEWDDALGSGGWVVIIMPPILATLIMEKETTADSDAPSYLSSTPRVSGCQTMNYVVSSMASTKVFFVQQHWLASINNQYTTDFYRYLLIILIP